MKNLKKFNAWLVTSSCEPISGTDRILIGESKRKVLRHLADEEGVKLQYNQKIVRLQNGNSWHVSHRDDLLVIFYSK